jgi:methionyl-tRNA synthetase
VGKDILTRFHATLWPAMLMGIGAPLFKTVAAHGWVLLGGEKISKSKGNVVRPLELADALASRAGIDQALAVDAVRHYLAATMSLEHDSTFTYEDFDLRYNTDLANDLGNALNRSLAMAHKFVGGQVPSAEPETEALQAIQHAKTAYAAAMEEYQIPRAVEAAFGLVRFLNKYIDTRAPWALAKSGDPAVGSVLRSMLLCLRAAEGLVRPFTPTAADRIAARLASAPLLEWDAIGDPASLPPGTALPAPQPLFPRLALTKTAQSKQPEPEKTMTEPTPAPAPVVSASPEISIEEFLKVQLKIGRILEADALEGSDKLLKLQVLIGEEKRQVVAGIRKTYDPLDLIGRQVVVCTNLKPAKLRGADSQGMLLAAVDADGNAILLQPDREAPEGAQVR